MKPPMNFKDLPRFKPKKRKLIAAILVLIETAASMGKSLSKGDIVKSLFIADGEHIEDHGRPITFDNYIAMQRGPVGDLAFDMLDDDVDWSEFGLEAAPWTKRSVGWHQRYSPCGIAADRLDLSRSDVAALNSALNHVLEKGFKAISEETHGHPAWLSAWGGKHEGARAAAMDWREFPAFRTEEVSDLVMSSGNDA